MKKIIFSIVMAAMVFTGAAAVAKEVITVKTADGKNVYSCGDEIVFILGVEKAENPQMQYEIYVNGNRIAFRKVEAGKLHRVPVKVKTPGWVAVYVDALDATGKARPRPRKAARLSNGIGVMVSPEKIAPGAPEPADFREFWKANLAELAKIPLKAVKKSVKVHKKYRNFAAWDVKVDCGAVPVSGYLVMPVGAKAKSLPAVVTFHGAGVRSAAMLFRNNTISFDVNAHGIENGQNKKYYSALGRKELSGYWLRGKESRDKFYFKWMFLRAVRALEYVKSLPEWNGKVLIVYGSSQGGIQSLVAAALDNSVTLCVAGVPALCDNGGGLVSRRPGWPRLSVMRKGKLSDPAAEKTARYYDGCNFAKMIKCPVYLSTGLLDFTCAPTSVYTVYNALNVPKHIDIIPNGTHRSNPLSGARALRKAISGGR